MNITYHARLFFLTSRKVKRGPSYSSKANGLQPLFSTGAVTAREVDKDCARFVPARVCSCCGHPLTREMVEPSQQIVGMCLMCRTIEADQRPHESAKPIWPLMFFLTFALWTAAAVVAVVWAMGTK